MHQRVPHGIINQQHLSRKDDFLFRVSLKGLIKDSNGNVLVVKETGRTWWDLPGGGMDHEESIKNAIARELHEEVGLTGNFTYRVIAVEEPSFLEHANVWQIRLVFEIKSDSMVFEAGEDGDEIRFIDSRELKSSGHLAERKIYEYSLLAR